MSRYDVYLTPLSSLMGSYQSAESFTALYERTQLIVFRYIYALHGELQEDVEDIWLETFLKAWRSRHRFKGDEDAALGWLLRIARNLVIDKHRRRKHHPVSKLQDVEMIAISADHLPENQVMAKEQSQQLRQELAALPIQQREMLILRYIVGWQVKQIAQHLDMQANTVSVTLRRGLAKLSLAKLSHQQE